MPPSPAKITTYTATALTQLTSQFSKARPSAFDPATVAWTGWWDGDNYSAGTGIATGKASAGASATHNLTSPAAKPAVGASVNGHAAISFTAASSQYLSMVTTWDHFVAAAAMYFLAVVKVTSAVADAAIYNLGPIIADAGTYVVIGGTAHTTDAIKCYQTDAASAVKTNTMASAQGYVVGTLLLLEHAFDGANWITRINNGAPVSIASGNFNVNPLATVMSVGANYNTSVFLDALVYEMAISNTLPSAGNQTSSRASLMAKYGISG